MPPDTPASRTIAPRKLTPRKLIRRKLTPKFTPIEGQHHTEAASGFADDRQSDEQSSNKDDQQARSMFGQA